MYVSDVMQPSADSGFNAGEESARELPMEQVLPHFSRLRQRVLWLNGDKGHGSREFAVSYDLMGNEPCSAWLYTEIAMIVFVPRYSARRAAGQARAAA